MAKDSIKTVVTDLVEGVAVGGGSSFMISQIWTETIHTFFVIGAGVIGAIAVFNKVEYNRGGMFDCTHYRK